MPNIGVYHQTVEPNKFVAPINLDVYQKGLEHQEGIAKENLNILSSVYGELSNIPAYGVDAIELHKQMDGLKNELLSSNLSNLSDPNSFSQINSIINKAKNNPRVAKIAKRGTIYSQELAKKQKAEEKGEHYTSPALDTLQEYYFNNNNFYENPQNVNLSTGWTSPQMHKLIEESLKNVPKVTKNVQVGGYWKPIESYDPDALQAVLQDIYNRDDVKKEIYWRLEKGTKGKDWTSVGMKDFENNYMLAQNALQINPTDQKALDFISTYSQLVDNPDLLGKMAKDDYIKSQYDKELQQNLAAYQYQSEGKMDADDFKLKAIDHQNKMQEDLYEAQVGLFGALDKNEQDLFRQGRLNEIDFNKAYQTVENNKLKNANAANPNYKITSSDVRMDYAEADWDNFVFNKKDGKIVIPNNQNSKEMIIKLIQANPSKFPQLTSELIQSLTRNDIEINSNGIEIDKSYLPFGETPQISGTDLLQVKNQMYSPQTNNSVPKTEPIKTDTVGTSTANLMNQYLGK